MANVDYTKKLAVLQTSKGTIKFKFYPQVAPNHCKNFCDLAAKGFYDNKIFHRVIKGFMIQGGCPQGTGTGGPGYTIAAEFSKQPHKKGTVAMARSSDPNSAGSQFYICLDDQPGLDGKYTVFGQVSEGQTIVDAIGTVATNPRDKPLQDVILQKVTIADL